MADTHRVHASPRCSTARSWRSQELAHSFRATAEWLRADHSIEVTGEAVRKLVRRIERLPVPPAPAEEVVEEAGGLALAEQAAQRCGVTTLCWRELRRAQRAADKAAKTLPIADKSSG